MGGPALTLDNLVVVIQETLSCSWFLFLLTVLIHKWCKIFLLFHEILLYFDLICEKESTTNLEVIWVCTYGIIFCKCSLPDSHPPAWPLKRKKFSRKLCFQKDTLKVRKADKFKVHENRGFSQKWLCFRFTDHFLCLCTSLWGFCILSLYNIWLRKGRCQHSLYSATT